MISAHCSGIRGTRESGGILPSRMIPIFMGFSFIWLGRSSYKNRQDREDSKGKGGDFVWEQCMSVCQCVSVSVCRCVGEGVPESPQSAQIRISPQSIRLPDPRNPPNPRKSAFHILGLPPRERLSGAASSVYQSGDPMRHSPTHCSLTESPPAKTHRPPANSTRSGKTRPA